MTARESTAWSYAAQELRSEAEAAQRDRTLLSISPGFARYLAMLLERATELEDEMNEHRVGDCPVNGCDSCNPEPGAGLPETEGGVEGLIRWFIESGGYHADSCRETTHEHEGSRYGKSCENYLGGFVADHKCPPCSCGFDDLSRFAGLPEKDQASGGREEFACVCGDVFLTKEAYANRRCRASLLLGKA